MNNVRFFAAIFAVLIITMLSSTGVYSQEPAHAADMVAFERNLNAKAAGIRTLEADFTQVQSIAGMEEKSLFTGKFTFVRGGEIRLEYITPVIYSAVIEGGTVSIAMNGKTTSVDIGEDPLMSALSDLVSGTVTDGLAGFSDAGYEVSLSETGKNYILAIVDENAAISGYFTRISMSFDKSSMTVGQLGIDDKSGNSALFSFSNVKVSQAQ